MKEVGGKSMPHTKPHTDVPSPSDTVTEEKDLNRKAQDFAEELSHNWRERMQIARDYMSAPVEDPEAMACTDPNGDGSPPWCFSQRLVKLLEEKGMTLLDALERLGFTRREAERLLREAYAARLWAERNELLD
jgi:ABC-type ATPase involved in cell division